MLLREMIEPELAAVLKQTLGPEREGTPRSHRARPKTLVHANPNDSWQRGLLARAGSFARVAGRLPRGRIPTFHFGFFGASGVFAFRTGDLWLASPRRIRCAFFFTAPESASASERSSDVDRGVAFRRGELREERGLRFAEPPAGFVTREESLLDPPGGVFSGHQTIEGTVAQAREPASTLRWVVPSDGQGSGRIGRLPAVGGTLYVGHADLAVTWLATLPGELALSRAAPHSRWGQLTDRRARPST